LYIIQAVHAQKLSDDSKNKTTRYIEKKPQGVCFETSVDRYRIKKQHTVSNLMNYFKLQPIWCESCSIDTAQSINKLVDVDTVKPGTILVIPRKCDDFNWIYKDGKIKRLEAQDVEIKEILNKRESELQNKDSLKDKIANYNVLPMTENKDSSLEKTSWSLGLFFKTHKTMIENDNWKATLSPYIGEGLEVKFKKNKLTVIPSVYFNSNYKEVLNLKILNNNLILFGLDANYIIGSAVGWDFFARARLQESIIFNLESVTNVVLSKSLDFFAGVGVEYFLTPNYKLKVASDLVAPSKFNSDFFGLGLDLQAGLDANFGSSKYLLGGLAGYKMQNSTSYKLRDNYYKISFSYLFE
ncbi:MAG: hypothetical protein ABL930_13115, partial [Pseudobdellovibrio sp.]